LSNVNEGKRPMNPIRTFAVACAAVASFSVQIALAEPVTYPAKGQTAAQQQPDNRNARGG
jgi:hypothetical protein